MTHSKEDYHESAKNWFSQEAKKQMESLKGIADFCIEFYGDSALESFFGRVLEYQYSPLEEGMSSDVGHIIYRLSDHVPAKERERTLIYPSDEGTLYDISDKHFDGSKIWQWDSLEDWRRDWKKRHKEIPRYMGELSGGAEAKSDTNENAAVIDATFRLVR